MGGVGGALLLFGLVIPLRVALRPCPPRAAVDGPAFTSIFQGHPLADLCRAVVSGGLFGDLGCDRIGRDDRHRPCWSTCQRVGAAPIASPGKASAGSIVLTVTAIPLISACAIGLAINVTHIELPKLWHEVADALGRSSLAIGLLVTGAACISKTCSGPASRPASGCSSSWW